MSTAFVTLLCLLLSFAGVGSEYTGGLYGYSDPYGGIIDYDYDYDNDDIYDYDDDEPDFEWQDRNDIGTVLETYYCNITIESAQVVDDYNGLTGYYDDGYKLVDVVITTENTYTNSTYMTNDEYIIRWSEAAYDYEWTWYDEDDADGLAPWYEDSEPGDIVTYHYIYEIPEDVDSACIEYYDPGTGETHWLFFPI